METKSSFLIQIYKILVFAFLNYSMKYLRYYRFIILIQFCQNLEISLKDLLQISKKSYALKVFKNLIIKK